ncbi:hypothetical protein HanXRQr2_Chr13g0594991 [Helianthus annuus]|uniref:Uncharacterized protein n=1 Tax=Helianthus annuus TaxID=4232 RepID=A0A9K3HBB6_HELAN|nr:hypothetical protein HanXRQr2_Chr13g0594991 [Helianthus annuus]KAJ0849789.1 hypothetical protein HanPSC8_Chr13g0573021 [Helianthus annuus]
MSFRLTNCKLNTINSLEMYLKSYIDVYCMEQHNCNQFGGHSLTHDSW